jgi:hypothetical protein
MRSRRLQFLTEILLVLFVFDLYAVGNRTSCIFEPVQFPNSHRCFGPTIAMPLVTAYLSSSVVGTLCGSFLKRSENPSEVSINSSMLTLYPVAVIPLTRSQDRLSVWLRILVKMYLMPAGPARSYMRRSFRH